VAHALTRFQLGQVTMALASLFTHLASYYRTICTDTDGSQNETIFYFILPTNA